jgi:hypothetical protein
MLHEAGQFRNQLVQPFIFSEKICEKVLFTANSGHLQALKVCDLKLLCPSQLHGLKDRNIKVGI